LAPAQMPGLAVCNYPKSKVFPAVLHLGGDTETRDVVYVAKHLERLSVDEGGTRMESGEWGIHRHLE
jgi:hypothetical protein